TSTPLPVTPPFCQASSRNCSSRCSLDIIVWGARAPRATHFGCGVMCEAFRRGAEKCGRGARAPRNFADLVSPFRHEKNANARRVAMIDAIAVANAEVHADFR